MPGTFVGSAARARLLARWRGARGMLDAHPVLAVLLTLALLTLVYAFLRDLTDLTVYRNGGRAVLRGLPLYVEHFAAPLGGGPLPFTYPPFAALLFVVLALLPATAVMLLFTAGSLLLAMLTARVLLRACGWSRPGVGVLVLALLVVALGSEPVRQTLRLGQINLALLAMVSTDLLVLRRSRFRGLLLGAAMAIKLTPAVFLLVPLLQRDLRSVLRAVASFLVAGLLGWAVLPAQSLTYWTQTLMDSARIGGLPYASNQSLRGFLERLEVPAAISTPLWLAVCALLLAAVSYAALRRGYRHHPPLLMLLVALLGLIASPVSWSHHWVWLVVPGIVLLADARSSRSLPPGLRVLCWAGVVLQLLAPFWWLPNSEDRELQWGVLASVPGNAYLILGILWLGYAVLRPAPGPPDSPYQAGEDHGHGEAVPSRRDLAPPRHRDP